MTAPSLLRRRADYLVSRWWPIWLNVLLLLTTIGVMCVAASERERSLRLWGLALELGGIITVGLDLATLYRQFNTVGLLAGVRAWFHKLVQEWPRADISTGLTGMAAESNTAFRLRGTLRASLPPGAALVDRVARLETNADHMDDEIGKLHDELEAERQERERALRDEASRRIALGAALGSQLRESATGSVALLLTGVGWLAVGVVLATATPELHALLPSR